MPPLALGCPPPLKQLLAKRLTSHTLFARKLTFPLALTSIKKSEQEKEDTSDQQSSKKQFNEMREGVIFHFIYIYIYIDYKKNKRT